MGWTRACLATALAATTLVAVADTASSVVQAAPAGAVGGPDFDNDGFTDFVVGMPFVPTAGAIQLSGALVVVYGDDQYSGTEDGTPAFDHDPFEGRKQVIHQTTFDVAEDNGEFDALGYNFVWGDFDGDGYDDLAAGLPRENHELSGGVVLESAGRVLVIYGSAAGLSAAATTPPQSLDLNSVQNASPQTEDWFGDSLVVGDFNNDNRDDLAVGTPYSDYRPAGSSLEFEDQGRVDIFAGSPAGLLSLQTVVPDDVGVGLSSAAVRHFGTSIGSGDVNGDGVDDLAIASNVPATNNGQISVVYSSNTEAGLELSAPSPDAQFQPISIGELAPIQTSDGFGESVDVGDFNGDGFGDVVSGAPKLDVFKDAGTLDDAGGVLVVSGASTGLNPIASATRPEVTLWTQDSPGMPGGTEQGDRFGRDVAVGYFDQDDNADLAISADAESIGSTESAGWILALYGSPNLGLGESVRQAQAWTQNSGGIEGLSEAGDRFGETLAVADYDGDGTHDLAVGAPLEDDNGAAFFDAGSVNVIFGGGSGLSSASNQQLFVGSDQLDANSGFGVFGSGGTNQRFGAGLDGEGLESDWARNLRAPGSAPLAPRAFIGDGVVTLIWRPPVDTGGQLLEYVIEGPGSVTTIVNQTLSISSAVIADLPNDVPATFTIKGAASSPGVEITATPRGALRAITATRFLETRDGPGERTFDRLFEGGGRIVAGNEIRFDATRGPVDADASAVMLNVVAIGPATAGFLTAYPCGEDLPLAASVNYEAGDVIPNAVFAQTSGTGEVCIFSSADTDVVVDVTGYVPANGTTVGITPARYLETRPGEDTFDDESETGARVRGDGEVSVRIAGRGTVPVGVRTVLLNLAIVGPAAPGFATVYSCGQDRPMTANINYGASGVTSNAVTAQLNGDGEVCISTSAEADVVLDVFGYVFEASSPQSLTPARIADTRTDGSADTVDDLFEEVGRIDAGTSLEIMVAGRGGVDFVGTAAVLLNVVAVNPSAPGFLVVYPCDEDLPIAANVNYSAGEVSGNAVLAKLAVDGSICVFSLAETDVVVDVNGVIDGHPSIRD